MSVQTLEIPIQTASEKPFIKQGDTIPKIAVQLTGLDITGSSISMQLYHNTVKVLDISDGNGITIIDANNFEIDTLPAADNDLPAATLIGDLEITLPSGETKTYLNVQYTIKRQYTR